MRKSLLFLSVLFIISCSSSEDDIKEPPFYLDKNGVTIKARDWVTVGTTANLNEVTFTAVDNITLREMADKDKDVTKVVTTLVTDLNSLYNGASSFNQDIGSWDVSNVTDLSNMFFRAVKFNQNISKWDLSKVINTEGMFASIDEFNQDVGSWNVSKVTNMRGMFYGAIAFNQDIGNWDVSNVTDMNNIC